MIGIGNAKTKLGWAKKHLDIFQTEIEKFSISQESYGISTYEDATNDRYVFSYGIPTGPDNLALIVGDIFYNLRSSLDQLSWALARINEIPKRVVQFPITSDTDPKTIEKFNKQVTGISSGAIDIIRDLQPYHRGASLKAHPLWRLNEMCNLDKHRRIPMNTTTWNVFFPKARKSSPPPLEAMDDRAIISFPLAQKSELEVYECAPVTISFGGDISGICESREGIVQIHDFVADEVIPRFEEFFR